MSKEKILVVEDDPNISRLLDFYLSGQGYEVFTTAYGLEAIKICLERLPHLVVLDVRLPDISGYDVGRAIRANPQTQHIPIVILTAFGERQDRITALDDVKAQYFLNKPFDIEEVHAVIKSQLRDTRRKNQLHPVTNLPTADIVNDRLRALLSSEGWTLALIRINGFESFNQFYGMVVGEDVLKFTALLLCDAVKRQGGAEDFVGQMVVGPYFVVISTPERIEAIAKYLIARFDQDISLHYDYRDLNKGLAEPSNPQGNSHQPSLMTLSIGVLTSQDGPFRDLRELGEAAEAVLHQALLTAQAQGRKSHFVHTSGS